MLLKANPQFKGFFVSKNWIREAEVKNIRSVLALCNGCKEKDGV